VPRADPNELVVALLERLLTDAEFRRSFRRDPAAACREQGLTELADELDSTSGKALQTLELRESKSSLAGVLMAAAAEGVGAAELLRYLHAQRSLSPADVGAVHKALTSPKLSAVGADSSSAAAKPDVSPPEDPHPAPHAHAAHEHDRAVRAPAHVASEATPPTAGQGGATPPLSTQDMVGSDAGGKLHGSEFAVPDAEGAPGPHGRWHAGYDLFGKPHAEIRSPISGTIVEARASSGNSGQVFGGTVKVQGADGKVWVFRHVDPASLDLGAKVSAGQPIAHITAWTDGSAHTHIEIWKTFSGGYNVENMEDPLPHLRQAYGLHGGAPPVHDAPPQTPEPEPVQPGAGGSPEQALFDSLLRNPRVHLSPEARQDLAAGTTDPRVAAALAKAAEHHEVEISVIKTGHDQFVSGSSSVSNHFYGRALDIASVDGGPVGPANVAARELAGELGQLPGPIRPTEIGSPWPLSGPEYFTDAGHENHIHLGFDTQTPEHVDLSGVPGAQPELAGAAPGSGSGVLAAVKPPEGGPRSTLPVAPAVDQHQPAPSPVTPSDESAVPVDAPEAYPGDEAPKEQIAAWMAREAHKAGLPGELPVMASLVESGLHNTQGGDRDSVGYFQMRTGIWDEGPYQGFQQKPELQLKWFIDHALAVKKDRLAAGNRDFLHDSSKWGDWIADVERPAEEYRGRYQLRLGEARGLLHAGTPPAPSVEHDPPAVGHEAVADAAAPDASGAGALAALAVARKYLGTPYRWGGEDPSTGFDCSGIAQYAYKQVGVDLPRVAEDQFHVGSPVGRDQLHAGDLVFFQDSSGYIHHEGIYVGDGKFLHAPHTGDVVKISSLNESYYAGQFAGGRRVVDLAAQGTPVPDVPGGPGPSPPTAEPADAPASGSAVLRAVKPSGPAPPRSTVKFLRAIDPNEPRPGAEHAPAPEQDVVPPDAPDVYPGDEAPKEQIAAWMAREAHKAGLPGELPVMASLVESGLHNTQGGDRDSVGYFQMRTGIWDEGPYQGFQQKPELQLKWFIDHALAVKKDRLAAGNRDFLHDSSKWGDWIADVERPAEEYRGRYQLRLDEARQLLTSSH
jgi:murein DD-endopeptidase MepM/ murein hydrolase activator NlpD